MTFIHTEVGATLGYSLLDLIHRNGPWGNPGPVSCGHAPTALGLHPGGTCFKGQFRRRNGQTQSVCHMRDGLSRARATVGNCIENASEMQLRGTMYSCLTHLRQSAARCWLVSYHCEGHLYEDRQGVELACGSELHTADLWCNAPHLQQ